ncbi:MAG: DUF2975 domain-containing protein [Defluviitaleaceae bacterium]|nr:DUF2975 domain-containing protein [Defluviitaleaceae bacterium]
MEKNHWRHYLTKVLVDIMFYGGIAACIILPFLLPQIWGFLNVSESIRATYTIIVLSAGVCSVYIVYQLKLMFKTLLCGNPFVDQNVSSLRKCAVASALIAIIFIIRLFLWFTIGVAIMVTIFCLLSLFSLTLKDLFKQAVIYKEETDWTV